MILIWGTRGRTATLSNGEFFCPDCNGRHSYALQEVKRWFTFFFIPIFPMGSLGEYVECGRCRATYNRRVLELVPERARRELQAAFAIAAKRVMFKLALADGEVDAGEVAQIARIFGNLSGRAVDPEEITGELEAARADTGSVADYLQSVAPQLNDTGKELVMRAAISISKADGTVDARELEQIHALVPALDLLRPYANGILAEEGLPRLS